MQLPDDQELSFYDRHNVPRPTHDEHGLKDSFEDPLSEQLVRANPRNWHLRGNMLHCETDFGPLAQTIPPNYIMTGVDTQGLPTFKKLI